jgi:hypothetical protein
VVDLQELLSRQSINLKALRRKEVLGLFEEDRGDRWLRFNDILRNIIIEFQSSLSLLAKIKYN